MLKQGLFAATILALLALPAAAQKKYGPGVSDTEIASGRPCPIAGRYPPTASKAARRTYFKMINEKGGVNGRKITLVSLDDVFSPPRPSKRRAGWVEQEGVLFTFTSVGTAAQTAVQKYLASKKVPQLFLSTGASKWNNPKEFPWTTPILHLYSTEGEITR